MLERSYRAVQAWKEAVALHCAALSCVATNLVDDIQTDCTRHLVYIGVVHLHNKEVRGTLYFLGNKWVRRGLGNIELSMKLEGTGEARLLSILSDSIWVCIAIYLLAELQCILGLCCLVYCGIIAVKLVAVLNCMLWLKYSVYCGFVAFCIMAVFQFTLLLYCSVYCSWFAVYTLAELQCILWLNYSEKFGWIECILRMFYR